jgi:putative acetyltransferase
MPVTYRKIEQRDNRPLAELIRHIFREFKIDKPGTVYTDPTTDTLFEVFEKPKSVYWLAEEDGVLLGGCGIYPTDGLPDGCVELVKFYLSENARRKGTGKALIEKTIQSAISLGYSQIYLESFPNLTTAISMYEKLGFKRLTSAMGNSGHFSCNVWMLLNLNVD